MRYVRIFTVTVFLCVCAAFGVTQYLNMQKDSTPPVLTSDVEELHMEAVWDEEALKQGLTAVDDRDGDLTGEIMIGKVSRFLSKGVCNVEYVVFDYSNNAATLEREVHFDNYASPKLQLSQPLMYYINGNVTVSDRLSVWDMLDGNIDDKLKIVSSNVDSSLEGTYELEVEAVNSCGDEIHVNLPVNIVYRDADAPVITLDSYLVYVEVGEAFEPGNYITSVVDKRGNALDKESVKVISYVDLSAAGCGQYKFEVMDTEGNQGITYLTVVVCE